MTNTTEKIVKPLPFAPVVGASIAAVVLSVGMTIGVLYWIGRSPVPVREPQSSAYGSSNECTLHYQNVRGGPEPELYVVRAGIEYFRQIDGKDIGELVKRMEGP